MAQHDNATVERARALHQSGMGTTAIARQLGTGEATVRRWKQRWSAAAAPAAPPTDAVKDMQIAALQEQVRQQRVQVTSAYQPDISLTSPEQRWRQAEVENAERIKKALTQHIFKVQLPDEPCGVTFMSDQHISPGNTIDMERMRLDAQLVAETDGLYAVLGGDAVDNHIKHRSAVMHQRSTPHEQYQLFDFYLNIFAHRVFALISGNHDLWTDQIAGIDVIKMISERQALCYAPDEAFITVSVGSQAYKLAVRHQYRMNSSFNETHAVKQWWRNGQYDWDIGCVCHHHVSAVEPFWGHDRELYACRPGSYQITSAYSRQFGFNPTRPMCPTFILYPGERRIVGFHNLRDAVVYLKAVRGK